MPLPGVVPHPPEFAQRWRQKGYWRDRSLADEFWEVFERFGDRIALVDEDVADTVVSLITANRFVNGEVVVIDGGYSATT